MSQMTLFDEDKKRLFDGLEELRQRSREVVLLLRLLGHGKYERAISKVLPSKEQRVAYEHSDGVRSSRDVASITGVPYKRIQAWWRSWIEKGIGEGKKPKRGKGTTCKARYSLLELAAAVLEGKVE